MSGKSNTEVLIEFYSECPEIEVKPVEADAQVVCLRAIAGLKVRPVGPPCKMPS